MTPSGDLDDLAADDASFPIATEHGELFYRGTLVSYSAGSRCGTVRSASGRELPLDLLHATVAGGPGASAERQLRPGMTVGYDVSRTSRGLRVSMIFPLDDADPPSGAIG